jgi:hypothetical protein
MILRDWGYSQWYSIPVNNCSSMTLYLPVISLVREVLVEKDHKLTCTEGRPSNVGICDHCGHQDRTYRSLGPLMRDPMQHNAESKRNS